MAVFGRFPSWSDVYLGKNQLKLTVPTKGPSGAALDDGASRGRLRPERGYGEMDCAEESLLLVVVALAVAAPATTVAAGTAAPAFMAQEPPDGQGDEDQAQVPTSRQPLPECGDALQVLR
jgi:hypothetical protein